jgi:hypothetical protein
MVTMSESSRSRGSSSDELDGLPTREEFDLDWNWDWEPSDPEMWSAPESGPIPPEVPFSEMVAYDCRWRKRGCLNHVEESCTQAEECRNCHRIPHLPDDPDLETEAVEE